MQSKDRIRVRIAQEAARVMAEEGVREYFAAKQKAAARLGVGDARSLPRNEEIDWALEEYHRLYRPHRQPRHIVRLRKLALEAMRFLGSFSPRLVGGVLDGNAGEFSPITLHLFPETPEDVLRKLMENGIPFTEKSVTVPVGANRPAVYPALCFLVDDVEIELVLLPPQLKQRRLTRKDKHFPKGHSKSVEELIRQAEAQDFPAED
ncbi:hypothetical protein [Candidatus Methylocalor cossyra]|uniref:Nucleotidyltransferase n=1 Tax=Candidatus Methylocalor cossyra TaxID=3108543 RepID=A0ABP1CBQ5_9GAMM